jgi:hypothetical protein
VCGRRWRLLERDYGDEAMTLIVVGGGWELLNHANSCPDATFGLIRGSDRT